MIAVRNFLLGSLLFLFSTILTSNSFGQCTDYATFGVDQGTLTIDGTPGTYETVAITGQDYFSFAVTCGSVYSFDFCANGGATSGIWPVITVFDGALNVLSFSPYVGGCSQTSFAANFTGTAVVYITDDFDGCSGAPAWTGTMAFNEELPSLTYSNLSCNSATAVNTAIAGGVYSFNPAPGGSVTIDAGTGAISNGTPGASYSIDYVDPTCGNTTSGTVTMQNADASFSLSASGCNSATATISGTSGGTFTFNPAPGGSVSIDAGTGAITNGTGGATYFVDYTVCGTTTNESVTLPSGDASFTLAAVCGGGEATITGDAGGVFTFNPAPGDGSQINTTTGAVSNGTVGTTYSVEYTVCGTSTVETVTVLEDDCWTLNGDAQYISIAGEDCIQLTDEINDQTGCAWSSYQIDFSQDFSLTLDYYFGNNIGGADGNTFTFQPSASTACGDPGGQLGAGGITNALSIEFDTYDNDNPFHVYDMLCDHVAIETDGDHMNAAPAAGPACAKAGGLNIDDGGVYEVEIAWDATAQQIEVFFDGSSILTYTDDIVTNVFGGQNLVYWGATSATGGLNNQQYFCPSSIVILPVNLSRFESDCIGSAEVFEWETQTEQNTDYFVLEYTYDGMAFFPAAVVDAVGNSQVENHYSARVDVNDEHQRYYRLKVVDMDGAVQISDIIAGRNCATSGHLIQSIGQTNDQIALGLTENAQILVVDMMGQLVLDAQSINKNCTLDKSKLATGVYQIIAKTDGGIYESRKIAVR